MGYGINYQTMFLREEGRDCLPEMEAVPKTMRLFGEFIYQGDFAVLCGPEGAGKSILGLQIADALSRGKAIGGFAMDCEPQKVVYLDFENKRNEFIRRYSLEGRNPHPFHENFARVTFHPKFYDYTKIRKELVLELNLKVWRDNTVLVVNNLDHLKCFAAESFILCMLKHFQASKNLTVLLITGTRAGKAGQKAGVGLLSRPVRGMADSILAVGVSRRGEDIRYIKQLKSSEGAPVYNEKRVAECTVGKRGNFTGFTFTGFGSEFPHVVEPPTGVDAEIIRLRLSNPALTFAGIATQLDTYKMKVKRVLDKYAELFEENSNIEILNSKSTSVGALPLDPFRGDIGLSNHPSDSGVKPETLAAVVTSSFERGLSGVGDGTDGKITLPSDPFRGDVGLSNNSSNSGVKPETLAAVVTTSFERGLSGLGDGTDGKITLPSDPFRGDVGLTNHPSDSGVESEMLAAVVTPVTEETLVEENSNVEILNSKSTSVEALPVDPFRGDVGLSAHTFKSGVNRPETVGRVVTPITEETKEESSPCPLPLPADPAQGGMPNVEPGSQVVTNLPADPFRGNVGLTSHPSDSGVESEMLAAVVTPVTEETLVEENSNVEILNSKSTSVEALPVDPFRGDVGLSAHTFKSGVNRPETVGRVVTPITEETKEESSPCPLPLPADPAQGGMSNVEPDSQVVTNLPADPFRGNVEPSEHTSKSGVNHPETVGRVVTTNFNIDTTTKHTSGAQTPGKPKFSYSQQLKKQFAERRKRK